MISATELLGGREHAPPEIFKMIDAIWCVFDALF